MKKAILLLCLSLAAISSQAVVAFNTFGPGDSTKTFGWGFGDLRDTRIANQFTSSVTGQLNTIELKLLRSSGGNGIATVSLFQDSGNDIGALMREYTVNVTSAGIKTITNSDPSLQLVAGGKYWIETKAAAGSGVYSGWYINNQTITGLQKFGAVLGTSANPTSTYNVGSAELGAFRVDVTPVPEPTSMVAMGLFAAMTALRRRKAN